MQSLGGLLRLATVALEALLRVEATAPSGFSLFSGNRSGCENLGLAIPSPSSLPCGHGNTGSLNTRHLGAYPARSAGLYWDPRIASVGLGGEGASFGGAKRYVTRATEPDLAQLLASAVE
jgi:hypothetical protein